MFPIAGRSIKLEYFLVTLLVCISGNQAFDVGIRRDLLLTASAIFLLGIFLLQNKNLLSGKFLLIFYIYSAILLIQCVSFYFFPLKTIAGFLIRLFIGYAVVRLVEDFPRAFVNVLFYTALVSFCFYIPEQLFHAVGLSFQSYFEPIRQLVGVPVDFNVLIYNFDIPSEIHRNSAFFWEPGAFAGYLLLALLFLGLRKDSYPAKSYRSRLLVLSLALVSTFSTTGYVVFPIVLLPHLRLAGRTRAEALRMMLLTFFLLLPLLGFATYGVWQLDFVEKKINYQQEKVLTHGTGWQMTRFGTLLFDWEYIKRRPLFGWGLHEKTRYQLNHGIPLPGLGNGLSGTAHKLGVFGLAVWLVYVGGGMFRLAKGAPWRGALALLAILLVLNGEDFLNFPLFWGLMFLGYPETRKEVAVCEEAPAVKSDREATLLPGDLGSSSTQLGRP